MSDKKLMYWSFVKDEATKIDSDGCSWVSELYRPCCLAHDLGYRYAKTPESAYAKYLEDTEDYWGEAVETTRSEVDKAFRDCIQERSKAKRWSPLSWIRYAGVRVLGRGIWKRYRSEEAEGTHVK